MYKFYVESIKEIPEFNNKIIAYLDSGNDLNELEEYLNNIIKDYPKIQLLLENQKNKYSESLGKIGSFERDVFVTDFINSLFSGEIREIEIESLEKTIRISDYQKKLIKLVYDKQVSESKIINICQNEDCIFEAELSYDMSFKNVFLCKIINIKPYKFEILNYKIKSGEVYHTNIFNTLYSLEIPETLSEYDIIKSANEIIDYLVKNKVDLIDNDKLLSLKSIIKKYDKTDSSNYNKIYRAYITDTKKNKYIDICIYGKKPPIIKISSDKLLFTHDEVFYLTTKTAEEHILEGNYREAILEGKKEIRKHTQTLPYI